MRGATPTFPPSFPATAAARRALWPVDPPPAVTIARHRQAHRIDFAARGRLGCLRLADGFPVDCEAEENEQRQKAPHRYVRRHLAEGRIDEPPFLQEFMIGDENGDADDRFQVRGAAPAGDAHGYGENGQGEKGQRMDQRPVKLRAIGKVKRR